MDNRDESGLVQSKNISNGYLKNLISRYLNNELQLENGCLTENLSELQIQLKEKCSKINELESAIENGSGWKKQSLLELQKCSMALEKLTNLYNDVTRFVQHLIEKKSKLTMRIKDIDTTMKNDVCYISDQLVQLKDLQGENVKTFKSNVELKKINDSANLEIQNLKKQNFELEEKNKDNYKTLQTNEKILTNLKNEKDQIFLKNKNLNDSMQGLMRDLKVLKENYNTQQNDIEKLKNELKEKNSKISILENQNHIASKHQFSSQKNIDETSKKPDNKKCSNECLSDESDSFSLDKVTEDDISITERMAQLAAKGQWARLKRTSNNNLDHSKERKVARAE